MFLQENPMGEIKEFDVQKEILALKSQTKLIRKQRYSARKSRLDKFKFELLALHKAGSSNAELQRFLRAKRIKVVHSTVARWINTNG
jgi:hypothetical protein